MMDHLLTVMELSDKNLDNHHLRTELKLINPSRSHVTATQLYNFRLWAKKEIERRKDPDSKKKVMTKTDLKEMFGEGSQKPQANDAVEHANELYRSLLTDTFASSNNSWKAESYLKKLKETDICFDYRLARDQGTGSPTAIVWQTGTMRADYELLIWLSD